MMAGSTSTAPAGPEADRGPRIGVFGGTFDPVHIGHLVAAAEARYQLRLDRVLMVVANEPWQKVGERVVTPADDRFTVVDAAVEGLAGLEASRLEIDRGGPSYTADTVAELRATYPGAELFLVVGADVAASMGLWRRVESMIDDVVLAIVDRGGVVARADPPGWRVERVPIPSLGVSSSDLRRRLAEGRPVDLLVPAAALRRMERLGLYAGGR
jgi:nicotinate-nucleotide adenylyltransferase